MTMQDMELIELIRNAESAEKLEQVADRIAADILDAPAAIVHVWAAGAPSESDKAAIVAMDLGPLPLQPLIAESHDKSASAQTRFRLLAEAADIHSDLRRHLFRRLDGMLDDETPLPPEELEPS